MLSLPRFDEALTVALYAFVVAMPLLVVDYFSASYKPKAETRNPVLTVLFIAGWLVGDALGPLAVYAGVVAMVWHLNRIAGIVLLLWSAGVMLVMSVVMLAGLLIYGWRRQRAERKYEPPSPEPHPAQVGE